MSRSIEKVGILGLGTMGAGIAQVCAAAGLDVVAVETSTEQIEAGLGRLRSFLEEGVRREKVSPAERDAILGRVRTSTELEQLKGVGLVVEAVVEDFEAKTELLGRVAAVVGEDSLIATNTSALAVTDLAAAVPAPQRFAGLHFFNPVPLMELVEVVSGVQSAEETVEALTVFAGAIGKHPVVTKDRPGFLVNRVLIPYLNQVIQDFDDGIATGEDIDAALRLGLGYPMGALEMLDMIGLDVHLHATEAAYAQTRERAYSAPPLLRRMVAAGQLGRKSGRGFRVGEEKEKA